MKKIIKVICVKNFNDTLVRGVTLNVTVCGCHICLNVPNDAVYELADMKDVELYRLGSVPMSYFKVYSGPIKTHFPKWF